MENIKKRGNAGDFITTVARNDGKDLKLRDVFASYLDRTKRTFIDFIFQISLVKMSRSMERVSNFKSLKGSKICLSPYKLDAHNL